MPTAATFGWVKANIMYPLVPILLLSMLKYIVVTPSPFWKSVSSADVSLCMGIFALFMVQAVYTKEEPLEDEIGRQIRFGFATEFQIYTLISFFLFVAISFVEDLVQAKIDALEHQPLWIFDLAVAITTTLTILRGVKAQRQLKLLAI